MMEQLESGVWSVVWRGAFKILVKTRHLGFENFGGTCFGPNLNIYVLQCLIFYPVCQINIAHIWMKQLQSNAESKVSFSLYYISGALSLYILIAEWSWGWTWSLPCLTREYWEWDRTPIPFSPSSKIRWMSPTAKITKSDLGWKTFSKDKFLSNLKFDKIFSSDIGGQAQARENRDVSLFRRTRLFGQTEWSLLDACAE